MGQPITVVERRSTNPAIIRFETNRPLSGMGHERYVAPPDELLDRPVDEVARRLFASGGIEAVHINGSVITVSLAPGRTGEGLGDIVRSLFLHYPAAGAAPAPAGDDGATGATSELPEEEAAPEATARTGEATEETAEDAPAPDPAPATVEESAE